jgi:hypothetical protein
MARILVDRVRCKERYWYESQPYAKCLANPTMVDAYPGNRCRHHSMIEPIAGMYVHVDGEGRVIVEDASTT